MRSAAAIAHPNIALVKYWGKRDAQLNLPAVGSISITLRDLSTRTRVSFEPGLAADSFVLNGAPAPVAAARRVVELLDRVRVRAGIAERARVESANDFPTGAGLASSASGFAALATAATAAAGLSLTPAELSALARQGSGSAARSIFGGFVEMAMGSRADGSDAVASQLLPADAWPLTIFVVVTSSAEKATGSTEGMLRSQERAPFWRGFLESQATDLAAAREAIAARDFAKLGEVAERSCLKMHGLMLATPPGLVYWRGATVELIHAVRDLRAQGTAAYFTIDAGPQVKVFCQGERTGSVAVRVRDALAAVGGVERIIPTALGQGAELVADVAAAAAAESAHSGRV